jgi:hypothetical protein
VLATSPLTGQGLVWASVAHELNGAPPVSAGISMMHSPSPGARAGGRGEMMCLWGPNPHDVRVTCDVRVNPHQRTDTTDHPHTDTFRLTPFTQPDTSPCVRAPESKPSVSSLLNPPPGPRGGRSNCLNFLNEVLKSKVGKVKVGKSTYYLVCRQL